MIKSSLLKRVAILGGSFDPPTISHLQIAAETLNVHGFDSVWIVPCGDRKDKHVRTPGIHRYQMCLQAVNDFFPEDFPVQVNDIEIQNGTTIPTYFLMQQLKEKYGHEKEFHFIVGTDLIPTLRSWHDGEKLVNEVNFIIYNRVGYDIEQYHSLMPKNYTYTDENKNIFGMVSSTEVRKRIEKAKKEKTENVYSGKYMNVAGLLTKSVLQYIIDHDLY